jgi:hypothetical protein
MVPRRKYRTASPFARAQLAPRRRVINPEPQAGLVLNQTHPRLVLLRAVKASAVKAGTGRYVGGWRWDGSTVTNRIHELIRGGWVTRRADGKHLDVTPAGDQVLTSAASQGGAS